MRGRQRGGSTPREGEEGRHTPRHKSEGRGMEPPRPLGGNKSEEECQDELRYHQDSHHGYSRGNGGVTSTAGYGGKP